MVGAAAATACVLVVSGTARCSSTSARRQTRRSSKRLVQTVAAPAPQPCGSGSAPAAAVGPAPGRRTCAAAAVASADPAAGGAERATITERAAGLPPPEVEVKVFGLGGRGAAAVAKLLASGKAAGADVWCLDVDRKVLEGVPAGASTLLLPKDDPSRGAAEGPLSAEDLQEIIGRAAAGSWSVRGRRRATARGGQRVVVAEPRHPVPATCVAAAAPVQVARSLTARCCAECRCRRPGEHWGNGGWRGGVCHRARGGGARRAAGRAAAGGCAAGCWALHCSSCDAAL